MTKLSFKTRQLKQQRRSYVAYHEQNQDDNSISRTTPNTRRTKTRNVQWNNCIQKKDTFRRTGKPSKIDQL